MTAFISTAPPDPVEAGTEQHLVELFQFLDVDRDSELDKQHALELLACFFGECLQAKDSLRRYLANEPDPITAARTTGQLQPALLPLLAPGQWDVRCNNWGLVFYPAEQTRSVKAAAAQA